jgi:hypothetical protein
MPSARFLFALVIIAVVIIVVVAVWVTSIRAAVDTLSCERPFGVEERAFPNDLPTGLTKAIRGKFGEIVPPGEKFDSTDRIVTGKNRRAILVWVRDRRWVIATEHGGLGYNDPVFAFDVSADGSEAKLVAEAIAFPDSVCAIAAKQIQ